MSPLEEVARKADALRALHAGPRLLVLPNAWDAASARSFENAGFPAIATTSAGVSAALGHRDREGAPAGEMLAAAARIARAVAVPVSVDFEAGYRLTPAEVAERLVEAGAAGLNLEDTDHSGAAPLVVAERHAERLAALKDALRSAGADLVLNARVDVFARRLGTPEEQLAEGLRRARLYREAGADCIYPITLEDEAMIAALVQAVGVVNLNLRRGGPLTLKQAAELGVRRVSYAGSLFRDALAALEEVAREVHAEAAGLTPGTREA